MPRKAKPFFDSYILCPHCMKPVKVTATWKTIEKAKPAVKQMVLAVREATDEEIQDVTLEELEKAIQTADEILENEPEEK